VKLWWAASFAVILSAQDFRLVLAARGVEKPTDIQSAGDGSRRLFLVQQDGLVRILRNGTLLPAPFLDIRGKTRGEGESGLLAIAFPPGYASKQRFYVNYTNLDGATVIAMYRASANPDIADPQETVLVTIPQPYENHNGGCIRFGPDGYLYIGMGDGGAGGDPHDFSQSPASLLGKMLRLDVESEPGTVRIPANNPFRDTEAARPEIWALGLRNPWRFSFDRVTGDLWMGDVGQETWEEVNFQPASSTGGENYGWNPMEGAHCYLQNCKTEGFVPPAAEYHHEAAEGGCSVTGGVVYRGKLAPQLPGLYLYGDYCSGLLWGATRDGEGWRTRLLMRTGFNITAFGEDEDGEVYVSDAATGSIYRIEAPIPE